VNQAGTTQVGNVNQAGTTQVQAVADKGAEVIGSIPPDYSDLAAEVDDLTRHLSDLEDTVSTTQIINTASGAIASFDDGADGQPIRKLVAQIEPVQDLHGYDHPWPGGSGANQWDEQWESGWYDQTTGEQIASTSRIRNKNKLVVTPGTTYYFVKPAGVVVYLYYYDANENFITFADVFATAGTGGTFTIPADAHFMNFMAADSVYHNNIAINYPSTVTTYSPYSNICPISGWTGAEIEQGGVNVWDEEWEAGAYNVTTGEPVEITSRIRNKNKIVVIPGTTYYFVKPEGKLVYLLYYDANKNYITWADPFATSDTGGTFTIPANAHFINFIAADSVYNNDISINYPATDTTYHPYTGNQISVTFPDTIYGGEDEVISGKLKSTMALIDLGSLNWGIIEKSASQLHTVFTCNLGGIGSSTCFCSIYETLPAPAPYTTQEDKTLQVRSSNGFIYVADDSYSDAASFKTAMSGVQLCYELAEPVEYTLTGNEMETLYGTNNIWSSTGDTEVEYPCDTKLYIDGKLAELQATILENIGG